MSDLAAASLARAIHYDGESLHQEVAILTMLGDILYTHFVELRHTTTSTTDNLHPIDTAHIEFVLCLAAPGLTTDAMQHTRLGKQLQRIIHRSTRDALGSHRLYQRRCIERTLQLAYSMENHLPLLRTDFSVLLQKSLQLIKRRSIEFRVHYSSFI